MGFGFVVARFGLFWREIESTAADISIRSSGFSLWTGTALVLAGVIVSAASTVQYLRILRDELFAVRSQMIEIPILVGGLVNCRSLPDLEDPLPQGFLRVRSGTRLRDTW